MAIFDHGTRNIEAILFDMNGTLRAWEPDLQSRDAAFKRMAALLEIKDPPEFFWEELERRFKSYGQWAQEHLIQLPEEEIWAGWLLPDYPPQQVKPVAAELAVAWSERHGRAVPKPGAEATLLELKRRGYRLGVVSNSMSSLDIPRTMYAFGWQDLFEVVVLSSAVKCRKPAPEIFWAATSRMKIEPARCAYLGNRISRDVVGCKCAGFALGLIIEKDGKPRLDEQDQTAQPDAVIHWLRELLAIFPARVLSGTRP